MTALSKRASRILLATGAALMLLLDGAPAAQAHHIPRESVDGVWYPWQTPDRSDVLVATKTAKKQWDQGNQYVDGGNGPDVFDCSGLVYYAYHNAGAAFEDTTARGLYERASWPYHYTGRRVGRWEIKPGDLIFYSSNGSPSGISHVAIYLGWNPGSQKYEQIEAMNPTLDIRINPYRTTNALPDVVRVLG